jgi:hypothetical protein
MASKQTPKRPQEPGTDKPKRRQTVRKQKTTNVAGSPIYPAIEEVAFLATVTELATLTGWLVYHTYDSRRSQAGFPDLVLARGDRLIFAELKTDKGRIRPAQIEWLDRLGAVASSQPGISVYLWRPKDWAGIEKILMG